MARTTVYNTITHKEELAKVLPQNITLMDDFLDYLQSIGRAETTIAQYKNDLKIFWIWNLENNDNKEFSKITKREFARFQNHCLNVWGWSPNRVRRVKSTLSSLSNFIENILDEEPEYEGYRAVVRKIENPVKELVREKSVFEPEELQALLDHLVDNGEYLKACVLALAMYSGRRKSELLRFKVSYFSEENVCFGSLYKTPEKVKTKGRGKGKMLYLYVLKKDFDPYLELWLKQREELGIDSEWLFPDKNDSTKQMNQYVVNGWVKEFSDFLGNDFYFHSTRHYYCTQLLKKNLPASVVQEIMGWDSADMVNLYNDASTDDMLAMYFDENGIKEIEKKDIGDI